MGRRFKIHLGIPLHNSLPMTFNSGGAGYVIDKYALLKVGQAMHNEYDICETLKHFPNTCDVPFAACLRSLGILAHDTRDNAQRERFHHFNPIQLYKFYPDTPLQDWWCVSSFDCKFGIHGVSNKSITFHWVNGKLMDSIHSYMRNCR